MKKVNRERVNRSGFTIMELVLAMSIAMVLLGSAYGVLHQMMRAKTTLDDQRDARYIAESVVSRLSRELQLAFPGANLLPACGSDQGQQTIGRSISLVGEPTALDNGEQGDSIEFLALEGGQYMPDGGGNAGLVQIRYFTAKDPKTPNSKTYLLVREERPVIRPLTRACDRRITFPITSRLVSLEISYYDEESQNWIQNWGNQTNAGLPSLIKFTIAIASPRETEMKFTTVIAPRSQAD